MVAPITKDERERQRADAARRQLRAFAMAVCFVGLTATFLLGGRASTISEEMTASDETSNQASPTQSRTTRSAAAQKMHLARLDEFDQRLTARMRRKYTPTRVPTSAQAANKLHDAIARDYQRLMPSTPETMSPPERAARSQQFERRYEERLKDLPR